MREIELNGRTVKIWTDFVDDKAKEQIRNLTRLPFLYHHLALMPDVHAGMGMPIGGVLACEEAVIPNAVGVDIGCGMCALPTSYDVEAIPKELLRDVILPEIRERILIGREVHEEPQDEGFFPQGFDLSRLTVVKRHYQATLKQIGTLGGGNHFIELQADDEGKLWVMIHSGSRNLGLQVCNHYDRAAKELNARWFSSIPAEYELAFLPVRSPEYRAYWEEMQYCIAFALANRTLMMERIKGVLSEALSGIEFGEMLNKPHNYAAWEEHFGKYVIVHRKGATLAEKGTLGIIPGSQGTASYIVEGKGNPEAFNSCSHGAGRRMTRTRARNELSLEAEQRLLDEKGILHALSTQMDLDEAPSAYKDIEEVIANQTDLVTVRTRLRPLAVLKG